MTASFQGESATMLDLVAKRYGKTPWELMEQGTVSLSFNLNVALKGMMAEIEANQKDRLPKGRISSRSDARALMDRAKADVIQMEDERRKRQD